MKTIDAYHLTLEKANELMSLGIGVTIKSSSGSTTDIIAKYDTPEHVPQELWVHVSFDITSSDSLQKIFDAGDELYKIGISFDTGGCATCRDWELDWSFTYKPKKDE